MATNTQSQEKRGLSGFPLGRIFGIDVLIHFSWLIVFALFTWTLADGLFMEDHPGWTESQAWIAGAATTLVFFACVLAHELAHSLVARRQGLRVANITLFVFGGVSSLEDEPRKPRQEFVMAAAGPATSFVLAGIFGIASLLASGGLGTALGYLAFINALLGVFNLVPAFPLDGGRVLRSIIWSRNGDMIKATNVAAQAGVAISYLIMAIGVVSIIFAGVLAGLWLFVIGWFLLTQSSSYADRSALSVALRGVPVQEAMTADFHAAADDLSVETFVSDYVLTYHEHCYAIFSGERFVGLVSLSDLGKFARAEWNRRSVSEIMTPVTELLAVRPQDALVGAAQTMADAGVHQLPVIGGGRLLGFVTRADIVQLLRARYAVQKIAAPAETVEVTTGSSPHPVRIMKPTR